MASTQQVSIRLPEPVRTVAATAAEAEGAPTGGTPSATSGFSVEAQGTGSFSGLAYDVPAHATGTLEAEIDVMAITSDDVAKLNQMVDSMLSASAKSKVEEHRKIHASGDISFWSFIAGGASATYDDTKDTMNSLGLTDEQITKIIEGLFDLAKKMSHVKLDFTINNSENDYAVSGDLELYTVSGTISTGKETQQYRLLANQGTAGNGAAQAKGKVIPLK